MQQDIVQVRLVHNKQGKRQQHSDEENMEEAGHDLLLPISCFFFFYSRVT